MSSLKWTRRMPGPRLFIVGWLVVTGTVVRAHDPGLSSLDVTVNEETILASLALSAADVALVAAGADARSAITALAHEGIRISIDDHGTPGTITSVVLDRGAARVDMSFAIASPSNHRHRLSISSLVANRVARGHRQLLVVRAMDHDIVERLLDGTSPPVAIDVDAPTPSAFAIAWRYVELGVHHILTGYDHLVFLAGLMLTARRTRELLIALTAFTAAHSMSLALVVIAGLHAPPSIVEPLIALSITWVGLETLIFGRRGARWLLVFGFGLVHGFGFAGALLDLGLGSSTAAIATALVSFNVGVEAGQLAVAALLLPLVLLMRWQPRWQTTLLRASSLMIATAGAYWLIERLR